MFGFIANKAKALTEVVTEKVSSASDAVASAKGAVLESVGEGATAAVSRVEKHWPAVEKVLVDGLLTVTHDRLKDDEFFLLAVEKAFELLPAPVRLVLPRSSIIKHSLTHRDSIVEKIAAQRAVRSLSSEPKLIETDV
ncbi:hypothetical protein [Pseudomonas donghuensis]|uniref:Uncharacterized protein n=1 Tax=Pseudomonas donghuensis TaxID=1163398 RepID=A0AAQ0INE8_9PSED|nr:hypothetical protein [Pseudomonas donghuensis]MCP6692180.1 hypothetical protein [Pseudomonas donghuensis]MDF9894278.1 hypothetical protein [Pseudomonas vranovensis]QWE81341.1 hypothetical protein BV82_17420 [Pseudomonas donghuensis]